MRISIYENISDIPEYRDTPLCRDEYYGSSEKVKEELYKLHKILDILSWYGDLEFDEKEEFYTTLLYLTHYDKCPLKIKIESNGLDRNYRCHILRIRKGYYITTKRSGNYKIYTVNKIGYF